MKKKKEEKKKKESERSEAQLVLSESKSDEGGTEGGKVHTERTSTSADCHYRGRREITACSHM